MCHVPSVVPSFTFIFRTRLCIIWSKSPITVNTPPIMAHTLVKNPEKAFGEMGRWEGGKVGRWEGGKAGRREEDCVREWKKNVASKWSDGSWCAPALVTNPLTPRPFGMDQRPHQGVNGVRRGRGAEDAGAGKKARERESAWWDCVPFIVVCSAPFAFPETAP